MISTRGRKFRLKDLPPIRPKKSACHQALENLFSISVWTEEDKIHGEDLIDQLYRDDNLDPEDIYFSRLQSALASWEKIEKLKTIPTTAQLERVKDKEFRLIRVMYKVKFRSTQRWTYLNSKLKQFKTKQAQYKEKVRVFDGDRYYNRYKEHMKKLCKIAGNLYRAQYDYEQSPYRLDELKPWLDPDKYEELKKKIRAS